jgi:hypothetical protein
MDRLPFDLTALLYHHSHAQSIYLFAELCFVLVVKERKSCAAFARNDTDQSPQLHSVALIRIVLPPSTSLPYRRVAGDLGILTSIAVRPDVHLIVADLKNSRVSKFHPDSFQGKLMLLDYDRAS